MKVLIVNAGSSSLKYQLVDMDNEQMIVKGQVERIAIEGSHLNQKTLTCRRSSTSTSRFRTTSWRRS